MGIKRKTKEDFIKEVNKKYSNSYIVHGEYINNKTQICVEHIPCGNKFMTRPDIFINNYTGSGCKFCNPKKLKSHEKFESEFKTIYGNEYELQSKYINADTKVKVFHKNCGNTRDVLAHRLLKGDRCPVCYGKNILKSIDEFEREVFEITNGNIECISNTYINNKTKIEFRCNICNKTFFTKPNNITSNMTGCPSCSKSKGETVISNILDFNNIKYKSQKTFKDLYGKNIKNKLKFDFEIYLKDKTILLEFDGEQHYHPIGRFTYSEVKEIHERDIKKNKYCIENNIELARIPYTEFKNIKNIINKIISSTAIPDEFKVVEPSGSKSSASLYDNENYKDDDMV